MSSPKTCLTPGCPAWARVRGLCKQCYPKIMYKIKKGELTEQEALEQGKLGLGQSTAARSDAIFRPLKREGRYPPKA